MVKAEVAFALLVRERPQAPLGPPITPTASDLGFTPAGHDRWVSNDHRLVLDTWHGRGGGGAHRYPGGVAVLAGYGWRRGSSWGDPRGWSAAASGAHGAGAGHGVLLGQYAAAQLSDGGSGWASADPFGMRCMYTGERADALVLASRAALAARLLAHPGAVPPRHAATAGWLGLTSYNAGLDTGFEGVAVVPVGARLVLDRGSAHWATDHPFHLPEDDPLRSCDLEELADLVLDEVATGLLAALDVPAERHVVRLTGGKDSRMVVAAAHRAGIAQEFHHRRSGQRVGARGTSDL